MLNKKVETALNKQLNREFFSSYLYLSMVGYLEQTGFPGTAKWMRIQAGEEHIHAMKFFEYIFSRQGILQLQKIDAPPNKFKSLRDIFDKTLEHELSITKHINELIYLARDEKDNATETLLQWFVQEQVEEESNVKTILDKMKLIGNTGAALYFLDQELGQRTIATAPPAN